MTRIILTLIISLIILSACNQKPSSIPSEISSNLSVELNNDLYNIPCIDCEDTNKVNELIPYFEEALHTIYNDTLIPLYFSETFNVLELLCTDSSYQFYKRAISLEYIIPPDQVVLFYPEREKFYHHQFGEVSGADLIPYYFCSSLQRYEYHKSIYEYLKPKIDEVFDFPYIMSIDFATYSKLSGIPIAGATLDNCEVFYPFRTANEYVQIFWRYKYTTNNRIYIGINQKNILDFDIETLKTMFSSLVGQPSYFHLVVTVYVFQDITEIQPYQLLRKPGPTYVTYEITQEDLCRISPCIPPHMITDHRY